MKKHILFIFTSLLSASMVAQGFQWAEREGDQTNGRMVATDAAGNSYVYGALYANTTVAGQPLTLAAGSSFLAKYDNTGSAIWVKQIDSMDIFDMESSSTGVYVAGRYQTGASYAGSPLTGGTGWDGFIASIDASGTMTWIVTANNPSTYEAVNSVASDNSGNIYIAGTYGGSTMTMGSASFTGTYGLESMFLMKMSAAGSIIWSKAVTTNDGSATGDEVNVASTGDIYVMSTAFGDSVYYGSMYYNPGSYEGEVLVHYDNAGNALQMVEINHTSQDNVIAVNIDAGGNIYTLQSNYLISYTLDKFNPLLVPAWTVTDGTGGHVSVRDVEITSTGEVMVAGQVDEDALFGGSHMVYNYTGPNGFFTTYTAGGSYVSLKEIPGNVFTGTTGMDAAGNVYATGTMADSAKFDAINLTSAGVSAMYLAKYSVTATGIATSENSSLSVFPNPCTDLLNCRLDGFTGIAGIELYNELGEKVFGKTSGEQTLQISLSGLDAGIYVLKISTDKFTETKKIIVK